MKEHNNDNEIRQLLQEKLEGHSVPAPDFVWTAIEKELLPPSKKRRPFFWWFVLSGLFLGTLSFLFLFQSTNTDITSGISASTKRKSTAASNTLTQQQSSSVHPSHQKEKNTSDSIIAHTNDQLTKLSKKNNQTILPSKKSPSVSIKRVLNSAQNTARTKKERNVKPVVKDASQPLFSSSPSAYSSSAAGSIMAKMSGSFATVRTNTAHSLKDSNELIPMNDLSRKTLLFQPDTVGKIRPLFPPLQFAGFSFIDVYFGAGRNHRTFSGNVESNSNATIIDRTIQLKNTNFGLNYNYQFLPFASARIGISMGTNRYTTRLFPIRIANTDLNNALNISSLSGDLKSAPLELDDQASSISDTTTFLMRIVHRSSYFTVPLSVRFNTTNTKGPQVYGYTGLDVVFRGNDQNVLIVRRSQFERSYSTSNARRTRGFYSGWHLGVGLASNNSRRFQFFGEFNYSRVFGNYYSGKVISIRSSNLQLNAGLRINL